MYYLTWALRIVAIVLASNERNSSHLYEEDNGVEQGLLQRVSSVQLEGATLLTTFP
jgi:hypothetical protein